MDSTGTQALGNLEQKPAANMQSNESARWLAVEISGQPFLIPLSHSGEIFPWVEPHWVPYTKTWFLGVVNLRGALCGVVDLSQLLEAQSQQPRSYKPQSSDKCFVGFHPSLDLNTVLTVDKLLGLKNASAMIERDVSGHLVDNEGLKWIEIDMFGLAKAPNFINIATIE